MKRLIPLILTFFIYHFTYGQETQSVTTKSNGFKENFSVLTIDKKIKHGLYKKHNRKDVLIVEGAYENNKRIGVWNFYSEEGLEQTYDFTTKEIKYAKKSDHPSNVIINGTPQQIQLDTPPLYIGSKAELNDQLNKIMTYPNQALRMGVEGKVYASVWVNENDEPEIKLIRGIMIECDQEALKGLTNIQKNWAAGTMGGNKIKSELVVVIEFKLHNNGDKTITVL